VHFLQSAILWTWEAKGATQPKKESIMEIIAGVILMGLIVLTFAYFMWSN
jgi:hypothetical protein